MNKVKKSVKKKVSEIHTKRKSVTSSPKKFVNFVTRGKTQGYKLT